MGWIIRSGHRLDGSRGRSGEENDNFYEKNLKERIIFCLSIFFVFIGEPT